MEPEDLLRHCGGAATFGTLRRECGEYAVSRALASGRIIRSRYGHYALPDLDAAVRLAKATSGTLCLASAALHLGWPTKHVPSRPQLCYPKDRRLPAELRRAVEAHWADLAPSDKLGLATAPAKTLEMSARSLPFDEALAIADSAVRCGFEPDLRSLRHARGRGAARIKRVVAEANGGAANPFESVLRAIALDVPGISPRPQVWVGDVRPDLVDENLRLILEADSYQWHGGRAALHRDANRYNQFVSAGWTVLRFSWEEVMGHPERVRAVLEATLLELNGPKSA